MAEQNPPIFLQAGSHPAEDVRNAFSSIMSPGIANFGDLKVTQSLTPAMSVLVATGSAWVPGSEVGVSYQGSYFVHNRGDKTLTISASNPSNPRIDLIVAKVQDAAYSGATNSWSLSVVTGTAAGSPVAPTAPVNSIVLARVAVAAAASTIVNANITDYRTRAAALGAQTICTSTTRPASPYIGQRIYELDTFRELIYQGATSGWQQPWNEPWGYMSSATNTTPVSGVTTTQTDLLSVTWTAVAGRRYQIDAIVEILSTVANDVIESQLTDASNVRVNRCVHSMNAASSAETFNFLHIETPAAGSTTRKIRFGRAAGSGSLTGGGNSTFPSLLMVRDIGPSANPT
ncbi:hypothetical protein UFOVP1360_7 [uncultured Caudovirales phage]|uniref:Uncharacterized protein n=1 Tax=uncultured Caudovirales phage TaxID=2100421 RepID=A0A6J5S1J0_9CAUD|nr:hypothetical protein UFOVP1360_7 [uncultured Caudovirales phage]